jgi:hypothetical protein
VLTAFEAAMERCSTKYAPWFVIPSNHKWFRNLAVLSIIADALEDRNIQMPKPTVDIEEICKLYHQAEDRKGLKKSSLMIKLMGEPRLRRSSSRERRCKALAASSVFEALDNARMTWRHYAFWLIASGGALLGRAGLGGALEE